MSDTGFVPIEALSKHLSVSVPTIRVWVNQGYIPKGTYLKVGKTYRFSIPAVVEALREADNDQMNSVVNQQPPFEQLELDLDN